MYFMVTQAPRKNTTICTNREALMFIIEPRYIGSAVWITHIRRNR